ncbi:MAG: hypothetical protein EXX96DRAFT_233136 [Benjaminiella poitrasii]|nr:MAG: hypothetical protein EXX96DRAFT_233136 [Benjaminiella poitrasii]
MVDEFYQQQQQQTHSDPTSNNNSSGILSIGLSRIHSVNITPSSDMSNMKKNFLERHNPTKRYLEKPVDIEQLRRHSFDGFRQSATDKCKEMRTAWDDQAELFGLAEEEEDEEAQKNDEEVKVEEGQMTVDKLPEEEKEEVEEEELFMFDYYSLPTELRSLVDIYDQKGKVERKPMKVLFREQKHMNPNEDESIISTIDEEETVDYHELIVGGNEKVDYGMNPVRDIGKRKKRENI